MPKQIAKPNIADNRDDFEKSDSSKQIKKESKSEARKEIIDQAVVDGKQKTHYILMLDDSYSMEFKPFQDLQTAVRNFLSTLTNSREASTSKVSCIIYNDRARTVFEN